MDSNVTNGFLNVGRLFAVSESWTLLSHAAELD